MITKNQLKVIIDSMHRYDKFLNKLKDLGVTISFIDSLNLHATLHLILKEFLSEFQLDWIDWWYYEDVEKIVYFPDGTETDITKFDDLYKFLKELDSTTKKKND